MEQRLKLFTNLIDAGSFTLAAQQLRISQPALSSSIKKLERELGDELLDRRDFSLTEAGRLAYEAGKKLHVDELNLESALAELAGRKPQLRIGMIDSLAEILFVRGNAYDRVSETASLALTIDNSARLVRQLAEGSIDVAFVVADIDYPADLIVQQKLGDEPLVLVGAHSQQAHVQRASTTGILQNFLSYNEGSRTQKLVRRAAASGGLALETHFYATSPNIMLAMVQAGKGIAVLPYHMVAQHISRHSLLPIAINGSYVIKRPVLALTRRGRSLPPAASMLAAMTEASLKSLTARAKKTS